MSVKLTTVRVRKLRQDTASALNIADQRDWVELMCYGKIVGAVNINRHELKTVNGYDKLDPNEATQFALLAVGFMTACRQAGVY